MLIIVHDANGYIAAAGETTDATDQETGVGVIPQGGQSLIQIERRDELRFRHLGEIVAEYRVDSTTKQLVRRSVKGQEE